MIDTALAAQEKHGAQAPILMLGGDLPADHRGTSLAVEPDGRITVAGSRGSSLLVARLLPDGALDDSFGTDGVFVHAGAAHAADWPPQIVRLGSGGYRVTLHAAVDVAGSPQCRVLSLPPAGAVDPSFGNGGLSGAVPATLPLSTCAATAEAGADEHDAERLYDLLEH